MSKCVGCGITLQNTDPSKLGYTKDLKNKYCERCFKTIHYNEERKITNFDNGKIIDKINKLGLFTVMITDILHLDKETIEVFKRIKNKKVLVINKCDLIPDNLKLEHLAENIQNSYNIDDEVLFISAKNKYYLNNLVSLIESEKEVIFSGETSSGKSTLINTLISSNLTTSHYDNTTLDFIKLKYLDYVIYDTPGIVLNKKRITDGKLIVKIINLNPNFVYQIEDLKLQGIGSITIYINERVNISSKKEDIELPYEYVLNGEDVELANGFIYASKNVQIKSNKELQIRNSIIKKVV